MRDLGGSSLISDSDRFWSLVNRYYDPATDQFMSVDPAVAMTGQAYAFDSDDPLNSTDPLGLNPFNPCNWGNVCHHAHNVANGARHQIARGAKAVGRVGKGAVHIVIDAATDPAYLAYWGAFEGAAKLNKLGCSFGGAGCVATHLVSLLLVPTEAAGIGLDAGGDWIKKSVLGLTYPGTGDEQLPQKQPLLGNLFGPIVQSVTGWEPEVTFPGIHPNGSLDFQW